MEKPHGKEAVKEAIIKASVPLFADMGVDRVSFREIAAAANVNHALITRHFGTKEELVNEVGAWLVESMFQEIRSRGETIQTLWNSGFSGFSTQIRAAMRIMLESSANMAGPHSSLIENILKWVEEEQARLLPKSFIDSKIIVLIVGSLMVGSELIEPYMQRTFDISKSAFGEMKAKAFQTIVEELQHGPKAPHRARHRSKPLEE
jgi:TetR/AcrR family transcriptional regulator, repressor for neighboring sulfatase